MMDYELTCETYKRKLKHVNDKIKKEQSAIKSQPEETIDIHIEIIELLKRKKKYIEEIISTCKNVRKK